MSRTTLRYPEGTEQVGTARVREDMTVGTGYASRQLQKLTGIPPNNTFDDFIDTQPAVQSLVPQSSGLKAPARPKAPKGPRASKYGNTKCESGGHKFDSKREMMRWHDLIQMQARGEIFDLELQVPFVLEPAAIVGGKKCKARVYIADFVYENAAGKQIVEDVKGMKTAMYSFKKHQMKTHLNIDIVEIK